MASLGRTKAANQAYREAIKHCQDAAQVNGERFKDNPYQAQSNFETIYDRWAMAKLGSGDRDGAREYLQKTLAAVYLSTSWPKRNAQKRRQRRHVKKSAARQVRWAGSNC